MVTTSHGKTELLRGGNPSSRNRLSMPVVWAKPACVVMMDYVCVSVLE